MSKRTGKNPRILSNAVSKEVPDQDMNIYEIEHWGGGFRVVGRPGAIKCIVPQKKKKDNSGWKKKILIKEVTAESPKGDTIIFLGGIRFLPKFILVKIRV